MNLFFNKIIGYAITLILLTCCNIQADYCLLLDVPVYDVDWFNGECTCDSAPVAAGMILAWHDAHGWPRMVHQGSNDFEKNPSGVSELVEKLSLDSHYVCNQGTDFEQYLANAIKSTAHSMDSGALFSTNEDDWVWYSQLKDCIKNHGPLIFATNDGLKYYHDGVFTFDGRYTMTMTGYDDGGTHYGVASQWITLNLGAGDYHSPAWVDFDNHTSSNIYDIRVFDGGTPSTDDDDFLEDNDSFNHAKAIEIKEYNLIANDVDWFKIYSKKGVLKIEITFLDSQGDLDMSIFDASGNKIDTSESTTDIESFSYTMTVSGYVYIKIYPYQDTERNEYHLSIVYDDWLEDNDTGQAAKNITIATAYELQCNDPDWFVFYPNAGWIDIDIGFNHASGDLDLALYDYTFNLLTKSTSTSNAEHLTWTLNYSGPVYAKVYGYASAKNAYTFKVKNFTDDFVPTPGNEATHVPINTALSWQGQIYQGAACDVYFGTAGHLEKVVHRSRQTSYEPGEMNVDTTYFWKLIAYSYNDVPVESPTYSFSTTPAIGYFADGWHPDGTSTAFAEAYSRNGGEEQFGLPCDHGGGNRVHPYTIQLENNTDVTIYLQDFCHEQTGHRVISYHTGDDQAYILQGCIGEAFWDKKHLLGAPQSNETNDSSQIPEKERLEGFDTLQQFQNDAVIYYNSGNGLMKIVCNDGQYEEPVYSCIANQYHYIFEGDSKSSVGDSPWGPVFDMWVYINPDQTITALIKKTDHSSFSSSGYMYLQKEHYGASSSYNIASTRVSEGSKEIYLTVHPDDINFDEYSNRLKLYARYENTEGGYAWVGPVIIKRLQTNGSLQVRIEPEEIRKSARWRVEMIAIGWIAWQKSGSVVNGILAGETRIEFNSIPGFEKPVFQTIDIQADQTKTISVNYYRSPANVPSGIEASYNLDVNQIGIDWQENPTISQCEIWRNVSNQLDTAILIATVSNSSYNDYDVVPDQTYFYWLRAKNESYISAYSNAVQGKTAACSYDLLPASTLFNDTGGEGCFTVSCANACNWRIDNSFSWISFQTLSGAGSASICYTVSKNTTAQSRDAILTLSDDQFHSKTFVISQEKQFVLGAPKNLNLDNMDDSEANDHITSKTEHLTITGTAQIGALVQIYDNGQAISSAEQQLTQTQFAIDINLSDGLHTITARQTIVDRSSGSSEPLNIIVDTHVLPPKGLFLNPEDDSGIDANDRITNQTQWLTISGTGENGAVVRLYDDMTQIEGAVGHVVSDSFSIDITLTVNKPYSIKAIQTDIAGNQSTASEPLALIIDTEAIKPVIEFPAKDQMIWSFAELSQIKGSMSDPNNHAIHLQIIEACNDQQIFWNEALQWTPQESWIMLDIDSTDHWHYFSRNVRWAKNCFYEIHAKLIDAAGNSSDANTQFGFSIKSPSEISFSLEKTNMKIGDTPMISGQIIPAPDEQTIKGREIFIEFQPPDDQKFTIFRKVYDGHFEFDIECNAIRRSGFWMARVTWNGDEQTESADSDWMGFTVSKVPVAIDMDPLPSSIKLGDVLTINGKIKPNYYCDMNLQNYPVVLSFSNQDSSQKMVIQTKPDGAFMLNTYELDTLDNWTVKAEMDNNPAFFSEKPFIDTVQVVETAGYAIIVQGQISSNDGFTSEGFYAHQKTAVSVYKNLKQRGLQDDDIYFIQPDDDYYSKSTVLDAVSVWAQQKMQEHPANLYIVFIDHGTPDKFYIFNSMLPESEHIITSIDLNDRLDSLQTGLTGNALNQEIIIILGFCHSGAFIDDLSGPNRVIVVSSSPNESSVKGPMGDDGIREGDFFISEFFKHADKDKSIKDCFVYAANQIKMLTASPSHNIAPYFDFSLQHPLLDDNGDKTGSHDLTQEDADGTFSHNLYIGLGPAKPDVKFTAVADAIFLNENQTSTNKIWAEITQPEPYTDLSVWIEIKPPDILDLNAVSEMTITKISGSYNSFNKRYEWSLINGFTIPGTYQVFYFVSNQSQTSLASLQETRIYKARPDNAPPESFMLNYPIDGAETITSLWLDWTDSVDPDGNYFDYTLYLSKDNDSFDDAMKIEGLTQSNYLAELIAEGENNWDMSDVYWKVRAIDEYGAYYESQVFMFHTDNRFNDPKGTLQVCIYDIDTGVKIANSELIIQCENLDRFLTETNKLPDGGFSMNVSFQEYTLTAKAEGYTLSTTNVNVDDRGQAFQIRFGLYPLDCHTVNMLAGWNMFSLMVIPENRSLTALFNGNAKVAYKFDRSYQPVTELEAGEGYWVKLVHDESYTFCGQFFSHYIKPLKAGWHLIGSVGSIATPQPSEKVGVIFGFDKKYVPVLQLEPGKAYWIKILEDIDLIVGSN
jgi:hypothetical protein